MSLVELNWNPSHRQLRQFGVLCLILLPILGWLWSANSTAIAILAGVGAVIAATAAVIPQLVSPLFVGLMLITIPIGLVIGELAMFLIYVLVFLPIGIAFRVMGRDRLELKLNREQASYWRTKSQPKSVASYYRQS